MCMFHVFLLYKKLKHDPLAKCLPEWVRPTESLRKGTETSCIYIYIYIYIHVCMFSKRWRLAFNPNTRISCPAALFSSKSETKLRKCPALEWNGTSLSTPTSGSLSRPPAAGRYTKVLIKHMGCELENGFHTPTIMKSSQHNHWWLK